MAEIKFSPEERDVIARRIQAYFTEEMDQKIGQFDAGFLLDFFSEEIGPYFYNRGLLDAQAILELRMQDIENAIYELEKPTLVSR
jgi:uncharacterized protein (DUF2164 family)